MKQHLLENGLKAVADYYLGCSKHVQASYERACRVVRKFYGEFGFEEYNPAHDDEIICLRDKLCGEKKKLNISSSTLMMMH